MMDDLPNASTALDSESINPMDTIDASESIMSG